MSTHILLPITIKDVTYKLEGELNQDEIFLGLTVENIKKLFSDIIDSLDEESNNDDDNAFITILGDILPNDITFGLRIYKKDKINTFEIIGKYETITIKFVLGVKGASGSYFHVKLNKTLSFSNLPLVGDMLSPEFGLSNLEFIYQFSAKSGAKKVLEPKFENDEETENGNQKEEDLKNDSYKKDENKSNFKLLIDFNNGLNTTRYKFPIEQTSSQNSSNQKSSVTNASTTSNQLAAKQKSSLVEINDFAPNLSKDGIVLGISAALNLSGFKFQVIGLSITIPFEVFKGKLSFKEILAKISFGIDGIALSYKTATFFVEGAFYRTKAADSTEYNGLLTFKAKKIQVVALASYIKKETYSSVFAFGYLGMTIPVHPAFNIQGLAVGFGLNRTFTPPSPAEVATFPLITVMDQGGIGDESPTAFFVKLNKYVKPEENSYVLMAGVKFDSFKIITTTAIASVTIGQDTIIGLIGKTKIPKAGIYNVELSFSASYKFNEGVLDVRAELTNSYILMPSFELKGSAALMVWFTGANAGDFVFTVGGYHPSFKVPKHYPQNLNRLAVYASIGIASIKAEAYFAITPNCMMVGVYGRIECSAGLDLCFAEVQVTICILFKADFIISWQPFYYQASMLVEISGSVKLRFLCFSKTVKVTIGASLYLAGPEFSGDAKFKVLKYQIPVSFGSSTKRNNLITKDEFLSKYFPEEANKNRYLSYNITNGIVRKLKKKGKEITVVNAKEFELEINSKIPITIANYTANDESNKSKTNEVLANNRVIHPMHAGNSILKGQLNITSKKSAVIDTFIFEKITQSLPRSIWNDSPNQAGMNDGLLKDVTTGLKLKFDQTPKLILPIPASLYEYGENVSRNTTEFLKIAELKTKEKLEVAVDCLFTDFENDFKDLNNSVDVYKYKSILTF